MILNGVKELLVSPSGVFGLLTLAAITLVTWHQPSVGGAALVAFCSVVPAILALCEHREAMAALSRPAQSNNLTVSVVDASLPDKGK